MRINTRELGRMLPVDVRVQIKALGLQGCVPFPHFLFRSLSTASFIKNLQDRTRTTLTMEDLSAALSEYGINSRKPEFYL
jgi:hypothetical protein